MKIDKHIEIARTENKRFSSMGAKSCAKIQHILSQHYEHVGVSIINNAADLELLARKKPDLVFLGLKKLPTLLDNEEVAADFVWISEYLDSKGISYTGSTKAATALDFNKDFAKTIVRGAGLPTADSFTASPGQYAHQAELPLAFPLFIKPLDIGAGKGVDDASVVRNFAEFRNKIDSVYSECGSTSLVETYLDGREFSVAILEDTDRDEPLVMPIEIITEKNHRGDRILGSRVKAEDNEQVIAIKDPVIHRQVSTLASDIYTLLGARDLGRIDIRMDSSGAPHFLEANFMPGPGTRYYAGACEINEDMNYEDVLLTIAGLGLARSSEELELLAAQAS